MTKDLKARWIAALRSGTYRHEIADGIEAHLPTEDEATA